MKRAVMLLGIVMLGLITYGCNSKGCSQPHERKVEQTAGPNSDRELAIKFLQGVQEGDKNKMYEAANLTPDIVNDSREKLIHAKQHKLTEQQRKEFENALRISGEIDFIVSKMRKMFPKSSQCEIMDTTTMGSPDDARHIVHRVKITYLNKDEAMRDKTGKAVKEMAVHLHQLTRSVSSRSIQEFSFEAKDFEKFADRNFEVLSYF